MSVEIQPCQWRYSPQLSPPWQIWRVGLWLTEPMAFLFRWSIPDCSEETGIPACWLGTGIMSLLWISVIVYFCMEWASKVGCLVGLSGAFMGLTFCAVGTSLPDALVSFHIARHGHGTMALSNAIGSNVFNIFFGLGVPWSLNFIIGQGDIEVNKSETGNSLIWLFAIIAVLVLAVLVAYWNRQALGNRLGYLFITIYLGYWIFNILVDRDVIEVGND